MKNKKDRELTDEELNQVVGGLRIGRVTDYPKDGGGRPPVPPDDEPGPPYVGGATPLPDPDFGIGPGVGPTKT